MKDVIQQPQDSAPCDDIPLPKVHKLESDPLFMETDLDRSGLVPADISAVRSITGYRIPYYDLAGQVHTRMYRVRLAEPKDGRRYDQPSRDGDNGIGDDCTYPYIHPAVHAMDCTTIAICEGEKKAAALIKHLGIAAIGIGGAQNWRSSQNKIGVHPVMLELFKRRAVKKVLLIPDDDVHRYDLARSYGTLAGLLQRGEYEVVILAPSGKIDDLLMQWGPNAPAKFASLPSLRPDDLVEDPRYLAKFYGLAFKQQKDSVYVYPNVSNVDKLLAQHRGFPRIWLNEDKNQVMFDEETVSFEFQGMNVVKFLQHNLAMPSVAPNTVHAALMHRAGINRRSPFREYLDGLQWDRTPRLERMFIDYCGSPDTPFVRETGSKWLPSAVWRTMVPGCPVDYMVITQGPQGIGKSTLPEILWGKDNVITTVGQEFQQKDNLSKHHMGKCLVIEEFDAMGLRDVQLLKAVITNRVDTFRRAYAKSEVEMRRAGVIYATTNQSRFLKRDDSGQRRFVVIPMVQLKFTALLRDRDLLWAEGVHRWRQYTADTVYELSNVTGATEAAQEYVHEESFIEKFADWVEQAKEDKNQHVIGPFDKPCIAKKVTQLYTIAELDRSSEENKRKLIDHIQKTGWTLHKGSLRIRDKISGQEQRLQKVWVLLID
jgi:predicted P-loop ATPase